MCFFVFEDPVHLYFIVRQFYIKYFFNLHHISALMNVKEQEMKLFMREKKKKRFSFHAIVIFCVLFESLLC